MIRPRAALRATRSALLVMAAVALLGSGRPAPATWQDPAGRQVVMFGVLATPGSTAMDKKISPAVAAQLRRTLPGHGFKLIQIKGNRVLPGQSLALDLGGGFLSTAQLLNPMDPNGKVQLRFELTLDGASQFQSILATPADQFNFFDKMLPNNNHLLIGVGAR